MGLNFDEIVWSPQFEHDLDSILEYYLRVSPENAHQHIVDILDVQKLLSSPNSGKLMNTTLAVVER